MLTGDIDLIFCSYLKEKRWHVPEIPAHWRQGLEGPKFKANLGYLVSKERKDERGWGGRKGGALTLSHELGNSCFSLAISKQD